MVELSSIWGCFPSNVAIQRHEIAFDICLLKAMLVLPGKRVAKSTLVRDEHFHELTYFPLELAVPFLAKRMAFPDTIKDPVARHHRFCSHAARIGSLEYPSALHTSTIWESSTPEKEKLMFKELRSKRNQPDPAAWYTFEQRRGTTAYDKRNLSYVANGFAHSYPELGRLPTGHFQSPCFHIGGSHIDQLVNLSTLLKWSLQKRLWLQSGGFKQKNNDKNMLLLKPWRPEFMHVPCLHVGQQALQCSWLKLQELYLGDKTQNHATVSSVLLST